MTSTSGDITSRAMLVSLNISLWSARKHDRRGDQTVDEHYGASGAGRFSKVLIAEDAVKSVQKAANAGRSYHYEQTLPWTDQGQRLLPAANFARYSAEMRRLRGEFDTAVAAFIGSYAALVDDARRRLNGLFAQADYPRDISARFGWAVEILPVPTGNDFRVHLTGDEAARIRAEIEARTQAAVQAAHHDLYQRLAETIGHMAEKLDNADAIFRDSMVTNLADLCELLPRLNLTEDPRIEDLRQQVMAKLLAKTPAQLRDSAADRKRTGRDAAAILAAMEGMYAPQQQ